jgi:hypothetical protein
MREKNMRTDAGSQRLPKRWAKDAEKLTGYLSAVDAEGGVYSFKIGEIRDGARPHKEMQVSVSKTRSGSSSANSSAC